MDTTLERHRRWLPAIVVLGVAVLLAAGARLGPWLAAPGAPDDIEVADGVHVRPAGGWAVTADGVVEGVRAVRLQRGPAALTVAASATAAPAELIDSYIGRVLPSTVRAPVFGEREPVTLDSGLPALALGYVGTTHAGVPVEGILVATSGPAYGVVFDAVAPQGDLVAAIDDVRAMVGSAEVG